MFAFLYYTTIGVLFTKHFYVHVNRALIKRYVLRSKSADNFGNAHGLALPKQKIH